MKKYLNNSNGFTYIEIILYLAIVSIVMSALIGFALTVIQLNAKSVVYRDTNAGLRYLSERIKYEIRNANGINTGTSNFGVNFADNSAYQLSLIQDAPNNPTLFRVLNGIVQIKQGTNGWVDLNDSKITVTNLSFTNNSNVSQTSMNISFILDVKYTTTSNNQIFTNTGSVESAAEIRSNTL